MSLFASQEFRTILADPPWLERGAGKIKRGADRHYPLMSTDDIIRTMLNEAPFHPAEDAHLYLWVTNNFLVDGLRVIDALGFRYVTNIPWVKLANTDDHPPGASAPDIAAGALQIGIGQYFRGSHELLLFAVRGRGFAARTERRDLPSVIFAERQRHSAKPPESYQLIEARSHGPRLEIFARKPRDGWTPWGNEIAADGQG